MDSDIAPVAGRSGRRGGRRGGVGKIPGLSRRCHCRELGERRHRDRAVSLSNSIPFQLPRIKLKLVWWWLSGSLSIFQYVSLSLSPVSYTLSPHLPHLSISLRMYGSVCTSCPDSDLFIKLAFCPAVWLSGETKRKYQISG